MIRFVMRQTFFPPTISGHCRRFAAVKATGSVTKWDDDKGFGFIKDSLGCAYFVHFKDLITVDGGYRALHVGQNVSFTVASSATDASKLRAERVCQTDGTALPSGTRKTVIAPPEAPAGKVSTDMVMSTPSVHTLQKNIADDAPRPAVLPMAKTALISDSLHKNFRPPTKPPNDLTDYSRGFLEGYFAAMEIAAGLKKSTFPTSTSGGGNAPQSHATHSEGQAPSFANRGYESSSSSFRGRTNRGSGRGHESFARRGEGSRGRSSQGYYSRGRGRAVDQQQSDGLRPVRNDSQQHTPQARRNDWGGNW